MPSCAAAVSASSSQILSFCSSSCCLVGGAGRSCGQIPAHRDLLWGADCLRSLTIDVVNIVDYISGSQKSGLIRVDLGANNCAPSLPSAHLCSFVTS